MRGRFSDDDITRAALRIGWSRERLQLLIESADLLASDKPAREVGRCHAVVDLEMLERLQYEAEPPYVKRR